MTHLTAVTTFVDKTIMCRSLPVTKFSHAPYHASPRVRFFSIPPFAHPQQRLKKWARGPLRDLALRATPGARRGSSSYPWPPTEDDQSVRAYWEEAVSTMTSPSTVALIQAGCIDWDNRLGLPLPTSASATARRAARPSNTLQAEFFDFKMQHPKMVVLVQVGKFFETLGIDALVLMEHAGCRRMGDLGLRAGFPTMNASKFVGVLIEAGFSVKIYVEVENGSSGKGRKTRVGLDPVTPVNWTGTLPFMGFAVTPGMDRGDDLVGDYPNTHEESLWHDVGVVLGVTYARDAYRLIEADLVGNTFTITSQATEETLRARLDLGGVRAVYMAQNLDGRARDGRSTLTGADRSWRATVKRLCHAARVDASHSFVPLDHDDHAESTIPADVRGFLSRVLRDQSLDRDHRVDQFRETGPWVLDRLFPDPHGFPVPRPLYLTTAAQMGVVAAHRGPPGVPRLIDNMLPPGSGSGLERTWLQRTLSSPPPRPVASAIAEVCRVLLTGEAAIPSPVRPQLPPAKLRYLLSAPGRATDRTLFRPLAVLCQFARNTHADHPELATPLSVPAAAAIACLDGDRRPVQLEHMLVGCKEAVEAMDRVIQPPASREAVERPAWLPAGLGEWGEEGSEIMMNGASMLSGSASGEEGVGEGEDLFGDEVVVVLEGDAGLPPAPGVTFKSSARSLFDKAEAFRKRVRRERLTDTIHNVDEAGKELMAALHDAVHRARTALADLPLSPKSTRGARTTRGLTSTESSSYRDPIIFASNGRLYCRVEGGASGVVAKALKEAGLDKSVAVRKDGGGPQFTTARLERALDAYMARTTTAEFVMQEQFDELAAYLLPYIDALATAAWFSIIYGALNSHAVAAARQRWSLPDRPDADVPLSLRGVWPYWLSKEAAVPNDVSLDAIAVLTGPNMGGKSSLLRSVCAASLLGQCGFCVPAVNAQIPPLDAVILRNFSADAPASGASSFAVEMQEMAEAIGHASPRTLILVDELGKGTDPIHGAAIAAAFLLDMRQRGCRGFVATHFARDFVTLGKAGRLPLETEETVRLEGGEDRIPMYRMGIQRDMRDDGDVTTSPFTFQMERGIADDSLALEVGRQCQVPSNVLMIAQELHDVLLADRQRGDGSGVITSDDDDGDNIEAIYRRRPPPPPPPPPAATDKIKDMEAALDCARRALLRAVQVLDDTSTAGLPSDLLELRCGQEPPVRTQNETYVYVLCLTGRGAENTTMSNYFYVGESDNVRQRLKDHEASTGKTGGGDYRALLLRVPRGAQGKSSARVRGWAGDSRKIGKVEVTEMGETRVERYDNGT